MTVNTDAYLEFVNAVTSQPSQDADAFEYRIQELRGEVSSKMWQEAVAAIAISSLVTNDVCSSATNKDSEVARIRATGPNENEITVMEVVTITGPRRVRT